MNVHLSPICLHIPYVLILGMKESLGLPFQEAGARLFCSLILQIIGRGEVQDTGPNLRDTHQSRRRRRRKRRRGWEKEEELTFEDLLCARHWSETFLILNPLDSRISTTVYIIILIF